MEILGLYNKIKLRINDSIEDEPYSLQSNTLYLNPANSEIEDINSIVKHSFEQQGFSDSAYQAKEFLSNRKNRQNARKTLRDKLDVEDSK